ncbi:MAG: [FeFe] hydrogenase H-cluster maturation GTPase HydF [Atopobiaceae bacterium]|jgi:[FeFe] hydrogenase H-cluster maturation GTPase HydF|nr:[FeFe] hydrogenase H-cluster maturation GTPase HydF [Atopobiaceae bacterium]
MGLTDMPSSERVHIGFFGLRNAGKSSLVNAVTGQDLSVVSDTLGTTTDPVSKAMEILPLGPVVVIDTPGFDDTGALGEQRVARARRVLDRTDVAVLVTDATRDLTPSEAELVGLFERRGLPYLVVRNKCDLLSVRPEPRGHEAYASALTLEGIDGLKERIARLTTNEALDSRIVGDLLSPGDMVVLVTPIDTAAPKGRMILPQQQAIRDVLDAGAVNVVTREDQLEGALGSLAAPPRMVVTDSQAFGVVAGIVPGDVPLTSFSILMARHKGFLRDAVRGAAALDGLRDGSRVLVSEGCTHHRQCKDIGTVKLPGWLRGYTGADLDFSYTSGGEFPDDLTGFDLVLHCGACMLNEAEVTSRRRRAREQGVPFTNYGIAIAQMHGILRRSLELFPDVLAELGDGTTGRPAC